MDLQTAQKLVHGLGGGGPHMGAVMACPVGAATRQETHQNMNQCGVGHHLLSRALLGV